MRGKPFRMRNKNTTSTVALVVLALLGVVLVWLSTKWGAGPSPDSVGYVSIARNLLIGQGYQGLYAQHAVAWPPLYPLLLGFVGLFGPDPLVAARWINAALLGASVLLVGLILRRCTRGAWMCVLGSSLVATSVDLVHVHSMVWTEPLFISFSLLGLFLVAVYLDHQSRSILLAAAAAVALAALTRYVGVSLVATGVVAILFLTQQRFSRKLTDAALFASTASLPLAIWMIRNAVVAGTSSGRIVSFYPLTFDRVQVALETVSLWLMPTWVPLTIRIAVALVAIVGILLITFFVLRQPTQDETARPKRYLPKLPLVMVTFLALYLALLILAQCFFEKYMHLDFRRLAPAFPPAVLLILCLADRFFRSTTRPRTLRIALALLSILFVCWSANRTAWWVRWIHGEGLGYARTGWRQSELISQVKKLDPALPVFTNGVREIYICVGRTASPVPTRFQFSQDEAGERARAKLEAMREQLENEGGVVVFFDRVQKGGFPPSKDQLEAALPLRVRIQAADGVIYEIAR